MSFHGSLPCSTNEVSGISLPPYSCHCFARYDKIWKCFTTVYEVFFHVKYLWANWYPQLEFQIFTKIRRDWVFSLCVTLCQRNPKEVILDIECETKFNEKKPLLPVDINFLIPVRKLILLTKMMMYLTFHFPSDEQAIIRYKTLCSIDFPVSFQEITIRVDQQS